MIITSISMIYVIISIVYVSDYSENCPLSET